jgi:transcription initiation factor TFIIIB Brf1 subunit/transcription initiation factor TFIIB
MSRQNLSQILENVAPELGLNSGDVQLILVRVQKLIQMGATRGRDLATLVLVGAYQYLMWPKANKCPLPPRIFLEICKAKGYNLTQQILYDYSKLFKSKEFFKDTLPPEEMLKRIWFRLKKDFEFNEDVKVHALDVIKSKKLPGSNRWGIVAAALYIACRRVGRFDVTQVSIAKWCGVTEVTLRNTIKKLGYSPALFHGL